MRRLSWSEVPFVGLVLGVEAPSPQQQVSWVVLCELYGEGSGFCLVEDAVCSALFGVGEGSAIGGLEPDGVVSDASFAVVLFDGIAGDVVLGEGDELVGLVNDGLGCLAAGIAADCVNLHGGFR